MCSVLWVINYLYFLHLNEIFSPLLPYDLSLFSLIYRSSHTSAHVHAIIFRNIRIMFYALKKRNILFGKDIKSPPLFKTSDTENVLEHGLEDLYNNFYYHCFFAHRITLFYITFTLAF